MLPRSAAAASVLALLLAGCLAPAADDVDLAALPPGTERDVWTDLRTTLHDLPCQVPVGDGTSANVRVLGMDPLSGSGQTRLGEIDVFEYPTAGGAPRALAAVARYGTGGVALVDVSDPLAPVELAAWDPEEPDRGLDVKFSPDGATVLVAGDRAIHLLDVRAPEAPVVEGVYALARKQAHMLATFRVASGAAAGDYVAVPKGEGYDLPIYRIVGEPGARSLERVATPSLTPLGELTGEDLLRSHDAWFEVDPRTGTPILWVSNVWHGVVALDVTDPAAPKELLRIGNDDPYQGYTHTVQVAHLDGRRLVVAVQEVGVNALKVWDATDLARPRLVALWHVPVAAKPQHNLQIVGHHAFVAHYAEGVFAVDLREVGSGPTPTFLRPVMRLEAAAAPSYSPSGGLVSAFGGTWDVVLHRGILWTSEIEAGFRASAFGCLYPGDARASSTG